MPTQAPALPPLPTVPRLFCAFYKKNPRGEELLRQHYRLSTAEAKEEAIGCGTGWGGDEEELVCGSLTNKAKKNG